MATTHPSRPADAALLAVRRIVREPFTAAAWRRTAYAVLALPAGLVPVGRWQRALLRRLLGVRVPAGGRGRPLLHTLAATPLNLVVAAVTLYGWSLVPMNLGWPLRVGDDYASAWGGPTFAGAWAFHAVVGGLGFLLLMPWLVRGMTAVQARLASRVLGRGGKRTGGGRA
ncbi:MULTISPECIES: hypothetical protein [Streptomyces]|uniref:Sensor domain-containing protein n=2 Tax=Streptomyces TaxID=1883 RepID=A0A2U9P0J9_STRAS|nr:hypothetical protein [Streptomyces actuosus]AWT43107.1 hypothetical protein DMT42_12780 [Streptomyces actuosus]MBM4824746.1 hypothetical protein [Streptomyces actuosus]